MKPMNSSPNRPRDINPLARSAVGGLTGENMGGSPLEDAPPEDRRNLAAVALLN
jgi:hypothetical protein